VVLDFSKPGGAQIHKHTLPSFVPVDSELKALVASSIKRFMLVVAGYLNAFVARREQVCPEDGCAILC
jgi:hypothetical protein